MPPAFHQKMKVKRKAISSFFFVSLVLFLFLIIFNDSNDKFQKHSSYISEVRLKEWMELDLLHPGEAFVKIIHFAVENPSRLLWKERQIIAAWQDLNPNYEIRLHSDQDIRLLLDDYYPEFTLLYVDSGNINERISVWKYLVVHRYGGFYCELEFKPAKSLSTWIDHMHEKATVNIRPNVMLSVDSFNPSGEIEIAQWGYYGLIPKHRFFYQVVELMLDYLPSKWEQSEFVGYNHFLTSALWKYGGIEPSSEIFARPGASACIKDIFIMDWTFYGFGSQLYNNL
jgi:mannosyltransferase OCH1-like enzyme